MRKASFADVELGDDIIVSFYIVHENDSSDGYSMIMMRTPKYEHLFDERERRVRITCDDEEIEIDQFLEFIEISRKQKTVRIDGTVNSYDLDIRNLEETEIDEVIAGFKKLNFDEKFKIKIV